MDKRKIVRKLPAAIIGAVITYIIFYVLPDLLIGYLGVFAKSYGVEIPSSALAQLSSLKGIGWGFVVLSFLLPLLRGTVVGGVIDSLTSLYIIYVIHFYLDWGKYESSVTVPVAGAAPGGVNVWLSFDLGIVFYLLIAPFIVGVIRGIVEVLEVVRGGEKTS